MYHINLKIGECSRLFEKQMVRLVILEEAVIMVLSLLSHLTSSIHRIHNIKGWRTLKIYVQYSNSKIHCGIFYNCWHKYSSFKGAIVSIIVFLKDIHQVVHVNQWMYKLWICFWTKSLDFVCTRRRAVQGKNLKDSKSNAHWLQTILLFVVNEG